MNSQEFVQKLVNTAKNYKTVYANGMFGSLIEEDIIDQKARQLPGWYTEARQNSLKALIGQGYFGFDCICFLKGILWGWEGDASKTYGGAVYESNGVPDINENAMIEVCTDVSEDFSGLAVGEYLWISGHCGIYIGDGLAVECTTRWENGAQITAVGNLGAKAGYNNRNWTKHGKLPYVTYEAAEPPAEPEKKIELMLSTLRKGALRGNSQIGTVQRILKEMGYYSMDVDNSFGGGTDAAVRAFQRDKGLAADGVVGIDTWTALLK